MAFVLLALIGALAVSAQSGVESFEPVLNFNRCWELDDRRADLCDEARGVLDGRVAMGDVLRGRHVNMLTTCGLDNCRVFHKTIADAVAVSAGFSYTLTYLAEQGDTNHKYGVDGGNISTTQLLHCAGAKFDILVGNYNFIESRAKLGMEVAFPFVEKSIVAAKFKVFKEATFGDRLFRFGDPFRLRLWISLLALLVVTSLVFLAVEGQQNGDINSGLPWARRVSESVCIALVQFTGAGGFTPQTLLGKVLLVSLSFVVMVIVAAFTANTAAFLVAKQQLVVCTDFDACVAAGDNFCMKRGSAVAEWAVSAYPELEKAGRFIHHGKRSELYDGHCENLIDALNNIEEKMADTEFNKACTLDILGKRPLKSLGGGWIGLNDYHHKCTSVLIDSLRYHLLKLHMDGTIATAEAVMKGPPHCSAEAVVPDDDAPLDFEDLSGLFFLHGAVCVFAIVGRTLKCGFRRFTTLGKADVVDDAEATEHIPDSRDVALLKAMKEMISHSNLQMMNMLEGKLPKDA